MPGEVGSAPVTTATTPGTAAAPAVSTCGSGVRVNAAHEGDVQHAGQLDVAHVPALAGDERSSLRGTRAPNTLDAPEGEALGTGALGLLTPWRSRR
jgi:hypothetical protein